MKNMEQELRDRLTRLETKVKERWDNHIKISDQRHEENTARLDKIFKWLEGLNCPAHDARMNGFKKDIDWLWRLVYGVIIGGIVLGVWVNVVK
jgi:hypothetical protein